jgi:hypothetical protein
MKTVLIVAPHFIPSFLPSVHRSRLWTYDLPEFGWRPIILTTHECHYECQIDPELFELLPPDLEVIRTSALPTKPVRVVGDISIRALPFYYRAIKKLAREKKIDFIHFTVPLYNATLLGPMIYRRYGIRYGIDYIDPWVHESSLNERVFSKGWLAQVWAKIAEPWAVRDARLISGINPAYFESVLGRNPKLRLQAVTVGMPYGGSDKDFEVVRRRQRPTTIFQSDDGNLHIIYAGAIIPKAVEVLDRFLAAVARLKQIDRELSRRLKIHFVGTGLRENDPGSGQVVTPSIRKHNVSDMVDEHPARISYLDTLNHLTKAAAILVIGSTDIHYSPSKIYQSVMALRPIFALLHEQSTAVPTLKESNAGCVVTFGSSYLPDPDLLARTFADFCKTMINAAPQINWTAFANTSARESARILANALDRAVERT